MQDILQCDAYKMIRRIISENMPQQAVKQALESRIFCNNVYLIAIGKASWTMAKAASDFLGDKLKAGIVITKYDHAQGEIDRVEIIEAGHPISDENSICGTEKALALAEKLTENDVSLFLVSGGGSALFEAPQEGLSLDDVTALNNQLLACGADIVEINQVRKRLSKVKAGRFAQIVAPAHIFSIVLSDVLGDRLDSIASGPTAPDMATVEDVKRVVSTYKITLTDLQKKYLSEETPKEVSNVETVITGSVKTLCESASAAAKDMGYTPIVLTTTLNCEAREAGRFLASIANDIHSGVSSFARPCAIIAGGETVVKLQGKGKGGRNQELAFSAAQGISGLDGVLLFSLGSDGTDGPTEAAGGMVDGKTAAKLCEKGLDMSQVLAENDCYHGLKAVDGLIMTGPTGTNVNDVTVLLCR